MSLAHVHGVLLDSRAKGSARLVLGILATYANEKHYTWPAVPTIALLANQSERQVQNDLRKLVNELKELEVVARGGGRHRTTKYRITLQTYSPFQFSKKVKSMKGVFRQMPQIRPTEQTVNPSSPEGVTPDASVCLVAFNLYSEEEREIIEIYHSKLVARGGGWLRVTMFTEEVRKAIALHPFEEWGELLEEYATDPECWPERKTLVRLAWHNHNGQ
ncbi:MAG: helix-turn-helix domain-containing protein [Chthoniobacteraceae bacterium]|jgi:hypothetical protein